MAANIYTVHPVDEATFAIEEKGRLGQALCYLLCGKEKALLIDTCLGQKGFEETVKRLTDLPVVVANTHAHLDHMGGNHFFAEKWHHEKDRRIFALHSDPGYTLNILTEGMPAPVRWFVGALAGNLLSWDTSGDYHYFDDTYVFELGGRRVEVVPLPGHTPGSVCFLDRAARQLYSGDSVCEWGVLLHFPRECCPPETYLDALQRLKAMEDAFDTIWPGHHGFPVEKSYIDEYLACAREIVDGTANFGKTKGRPCAKHGRVLISIPKEVVARG